MACLTFSGSEFMPIYYNIDQRVGKNCPNKAEDLALVTYLISLVAELPSTGPIAKPLLRKVSVGVADQALIDAIIELERQTPGAPKDGYISKAVGGVSYAPQSPFQICKLNYNVAKGYSDLWPRIDKMPGANQTIKGLVQRVLMAA